MRNVALVLLALTLPTVALGQNQAPTWHWDQFFKNGMTHDFGSVPRGTQLFYKFKMKNIYAVPLVVDARVGCHCVTVTPTSQVLQPRQEATLDVSMDTSKLAGHKSVNIYIDVGPQFVSHTTLTVSCISRTDVVVNPGQIGFGVVPAGQGTAPQTIDVEYAGVLDWRITEVVKHDAPIELTYRELYRRPGQVGYQVAVALKPDAAAGPLKHELFLKTNDPASPLVPILVEANIQASLNVAPNIVHMGNLRVGESATKLVIVKASKPFHITAVEGQGDGVVAELPPTPAQVQVLRVKFQPGKPGEVRRQLRIKTDLDRESTASVMVDGTVEASAPELIRTP
jgi:Protein of unknown function (DUF1573)